MNKVLIRDILRLTFSIIFSPFYVFHLLFMMKNKDIIYADALNTGTDYLNLKGCLAVLYLLHNNRYFRSLFYFRIGPVLSMLIEWYRPGDRYFVISQTTVIGPGVKIAHPYSTILNAESIGSNFSCIHLTTLGKKNGKRPIIGDNVTLGANVSIIGDVRVGNNVIIGAGSVVVKDIPDNAIAVGNPAKVIKFIE